MRRRCCLIIPRRGRKERRRERKRDVRFETNSYKGVEFTDLSKKRRGNVLGQLYKVSNGS